MILVGHTWATTLIYLTGDRAGKSQNPAEAQNIIDNAIREGGKIHQNGSHVTREVSAYVTERIHQAEMKKGLADSLPWSAAEDARLKLEEGLKLYGVPLEVDGTSAGITIRPDDPSIPAPNSTTGHVQISLYTEECVV